MFISFVILPTIKAAEKGNYSSRSDITVSVMVSDDRKKKHNAGVAEHISFSIGHRA